MAGSVSLFIKAVDCGYRYDWLQIFALPGFNRMASFGSSDLHYLSTTPQATPTQNHP